MASVTTPRRPPIVLTLVMLVVLVIVGLIALKWITSLIMTVIQIGLILVALYFIARIGLYLLRKGN